jgi:hypothetical protein
MSNVARSDTAVESRSIPVVDGVPVTMGTSAVAEWVGRLGDTEPDAYASLTPAERIEMVWPITVTAVPEPSTLVLLGIGGAVARWHERPCHQEVGHPATE